MYRPPSQIESQKVAIELGEQKNSLLNISSASHIFFSVFFIKTKVKINKNSLTQESVGREGKLRFCKAAETF